MSQSRHSQIHVSFWAIGARVVPNHIPVPSRVPLAGVVLQQILPVAAAVANAGDVALRPRQRHLHRAIAHHHLHARGVSFTCRFNNFDLQGCKEIQQAKE